MPLQPIDPEELPSPGDRAVVIPGGTPPLPSLDSIDTQGPTPSAEVEGRAAPAPAAAPSPAPLSAAVPQKSARDQLMDPAMSEMLATIAHKRAAVATAQGKADQARKWAAIGNDFVRAADLFAGRKTDEAALQARLEGADRPVQQVLQQQGVAREGLKDATATLALNKELTGQREVLASRDPDSELSRRARMLAQVTGIAPAGADLSFLSASELQPLLELTKTQAGIEHARGMLGEQLAHHAEENKLGWAKLREGITARREDLKLKLQEQGLQRQALMAQRLDKDNERELNQLGKQDQKGRAAMAALEAAEKLVGNLEGNPDVPGIGPIAGRLPTMLLSQAGQENQALSTEMMKSLLLAKGGPVTKEAVEQQKKALGMNPGASVETFKKGVKMALDELAKAMQQREAGVRPENVAAFRERGGMTTEQVRKLAERVAGAGAAPAPAAGGPVFIRVRDRKTGLVKSLPPDRAAKYTADPNFEEVR